MSENLLHKWTEVTGNLDWGKQRTLLDTLNLVSEGKVKVVYGANDFNGSPCLINAVGCMVKDKDQQPMTNEPALVELFDKICRTVFAPAGIVKHYQNYTGYLTDFAADILIRNFAPLKPIPAMTTVATEAKYVEPKDADLHADLEQALIDAQNIQDMNYEPESEPARKSE